MRFREHRGTLAASMETVVEVADRAALIEHARKLLAPYKFEERFQGYAIGKISVEPYGGDDERIGWKDVHIVTLPGYGVLGFTEGPVPE